MMLFCSPFIIIVFCVINVSQTFLIYDQFATIYELKVIALKISNIFQGISYDIDFSEENRRNKMTGAMDSVIAAVALFDSSPSKLNYLNDVEINGIKIIENSAMEMFYLLKLIELEFLRFKKTAELLKKHNVKLSIIKPDAHLDIMELLSRFRNSLMAENQDPINPSVLQIVVELERQRNHECKNNHIPPISYVMYDIYLISVSSILKAFAIDVLDHQYRCFFERNITLHQLNRHIENKLGIVNNMIENGNLIMGSKVGFMNREYINCPYSKLSRDVNFFELERVFQLIVIPEEAVKEEMEKYTCFGSCRDTIGDNFNDQLCTGNSCVTCEGRIRDCRSGPPRVRICVPKLYSSRRYEWIMLYGASHTEKYGFSKSHNNSCWKIADVYPDFLDYGARGICEYCVCTCEENSHKSSKSTFIISSQMANADVEKKMVVTGVRFVKKDRIIYTQIKQAKLMPGGWIDEETNIWKPIEKLNRDEVNAHIKNEKTLKNNTFIIISQNVRSLNLNDVFCPSENHVVTGVGLGISKTVVDINRITLFITCQLVTFKEADFLSSNNTGPIENTHSRTIEILNGGVPPDQVIKSNERDISNGYYVKFNMSDWIEDAGQSVFPWFDARDVAPTPSIPLVGIGLNLRGGGSSGGLLGYKLHSIRYSNFM